MPSFLASSLKSASSSATMASSSGSGASSHSHSTDPSVFKLHTLGAPHTTTFCSGAIHLQRQVSRLCEEGLWESAVILGSFLVSHSLKKSLVPGSIPTKLNSSSKHSNHHNSDGASCAAEGSFAISLELYANALAGAGELKRASMHYQRALQMCKNAAPSQAVDDLERRVRLKLARNAKRLGDFELALSILQSVRVPLRSAAIWIELGRLLAISGKTRQAGSAFQEALKANPYALAAAEELMKLSGKSTSTRTKKLFEECLKSRAMHDRDAPWVSKILEYNMFLWSCKPGKAAESCNRLIYNFPNQAYCLSLQGKAYYEMGSDEKCVHYLQKAREIDPFILDNASTLSMALCAQGNSAALAALTHDLFSIDDTRPEPWLSAAVYSDMQGETAKALKFVSKCLAIDSSNIHGLQIKAKLLLSQGHPETALPIYSKLHAMRRDVSTYQGLVEAYLAVNRTGEAIRISKEALKVHLKDARIVVLCGQVLAKTGEFAKAARTLKKALKMQPSSREAAWMFANVVMQEMKTTNQISIELPFAIKTIQDILKYESMREDCRSNPIDLHVKLGDLVLASGDFQGSIQHYHAALSIGFSHEAQRGIEVAQKRMRGEGDDPEDDESDDMADM